MTSGGAICRGSEVNDALTASMAVGTRRTRNREDQFARDCSLGAIRWTGQAQRDSPTASGQVQLTIGLGLIHSNGVYCPGEVEISETEKVDGAIERISCAGCTRGHGLRIISGR